MGVGSGLGGLEAKVGPGGYFASMITSLNLSPPATGDHEQPFPVPPVPPLFCLPGKLCQLLLLLLDLVQAKDFAKISIHSFSSFYSPH